MRWVKYLFVSGRTPLICTVETRIKEPTFLGDSLLKAICLYNQNIKDKKCEFDEDTRKLIVITVMLVIFF